MNLRIKIKAKNKQKNILLKEPQNYLVKNYLLNTHKKIENMVLKKEKMDG